jgi:hypothetical protein
VKKTDKSYDEMIFKKPTSKVDQILRREILKTRLEPKRKVDVFGILIVKLRESTFMQVIMGIIACYLLYLIVGGIKLIQILLTLLIGMTLISVFVTSVLSKYQKKK